MARFAYPLTNARPSPTGYTIDPEEQFGATMHAESMGWEIGGVFHSHPDGEPVLSEADVALAADPRWAYLVHAGGEIRAYSVRDGVAAEIEVHWLGPDLPGRSRVT